MPHAHLSAEEVKGLPEEGGKARPATSRQTFQRTLIAQMLNVQDSFVSAQNLHDQISQAGHRIGLATVYRSLQTMAEEGELDSIRSGNEVLYRRCRSEEHHHHLICRICGKTVEVSGADAEVWAEKVARAAGFTKVDHTIELTGVCGKCTE